MKVLLDMNLPPSWVKFLEGHRIEALHWIDVGDPRVKDQFIMDWARERGYIVFTHDLDFSTLLALTRDTGPSVLQVRTQDVLPDAIGLNVVKVLRDHEEVLNAGAIVTIDETTSRLRILPIGA